MKKIFGPFFSSVVLYAIAIHCGCTRIYSFLSVEAGMPIVFMTIVSGSARDKSSSNELFSFWKSVWTQSIL